LGLTKGLDWGEDQQMSTYDNLYYLPIYHMSIACNERKPQKIRFSHKNDEEMGKNGGCEMKRE